MAKVQHNRVTAPGILQIGFSRNNTCAIKDGFCRDSHICVSPTYVACVVAVQYRHQEFRSRL